MYIYTVHVLAVMYSTVEDYERNDGSSEHPYFMSKRLKKLLGVKNKFEHTDDGSDGGGGDLHLEPVPSSEK